MKPTKTSAKAPSSEKDQMALEKARLELRLLRLDQYLKPLSLATPVVLAVGIYFLVQAPSIESSDASRCLDEVRIIQDLEELNDETDLVDYLTVTQALLTCEPVRILAASRAATIQARQAIASADREISAAEIGAVPLQEGAEPTSCETILLDEATEQNSVFRARLQELSRDLGELVEQRNELVAEAQAELYGLDGRPPGEGPRFHLIQDRIYDLEREIADLQGLIDQQRQLIEERNSQFTASLQTCRSASGGG